MIENFQEKLHQESVNNQKVQKFVPVLDGILRVKMLQIILQNIWKTKYAKSNKYKTFQ